ncbi:MAG: hypothetical protein HYR85_25290 [Planctomycetes bacterium]|nr:hypothetical protein [Planctomycetota bacterium]
MIRRLAPVAALLFTTALTAAGAPRADRDFSANDLKALSWRSVGPANMGGRVSAIALVPGSRRSFYVGYGTGGVFKTENLGVTFAPVFDDQPLLSIGSIAVADAPADWPGWKNEPPSKDAKPDLAALGKGKIVWVGTGEGNGRNSSSWGGGIYRSTDAGSTFTHVGLTETHDVPRLAVDPRNPDVCYVAALGHLWGANAERGVFKTMDGGATWQHAVKVDDKTGACDVAIDPKTPDTVYAALYARRRTPWSFTGVGETGGIFRSDDAGKTWKKLTSGLPTRTGRIGFAIYAKDPRIVYATVESDVGGTGKNEMDDHSPSGGLFRSADRGETWARVNDLSFRPFYFSRIAIDSENDQRVYMPGWDLAISDDGGRTFRRSGSELVHVDFHAIAVNPEDPNQVLVGNDGGVYVSHDRAEHWDHLNNVAAGQFYRVAVDASDPYRIAGGLQDNGSWLGPSETLSITEDDAKDGILSDDWKTIFGSDGFGVAFDPEDRNVVYATSQGAGIARIRLDNNVQKLIRPAAREGQERFRFNWNAPFLVSPHDPSVLYLGGNKAFKLTSRGDQWAAISEDLSRREVGKIDTVGSSAETYGTIVALAESPLAKGQIWAGTDDGRVHVTEDDGKTWTDVTPAAVGGLYVSRIAPSPHDAKTAYVSVDGHRSDVFKPLVLATSDAGRTWTEITGDLPAGGPVKVVVEDPSSADVLYCGTEFGCYVTLDRGKHWVRMNGKSLPPAPVDDIVIHPREHDLVVGTHGRSIWVFDDASMFAQMDAATRSKPLALFDLLPATPRLYASRAYGEGAGIFRAKNPPMGANIDYWLAATADDAISISIADPSGFVIRKLDGPGRAGINRVTWDLQADAKHRFKSVDETELGQTAFVAPGDYTVTITMGKAKDEKKVKVLPLPGPAR